MDLSGSFDLIKTWECLACCGAGVFHDLSSYGNQIHARKLFVTFLVESESR